jgi:hypothetical protein
MESVAHSRYCPVGLPTGRPRFRAAPGRVESRNGPSRRVKLGSLEYRQYSSVGGGQAKTPIQGARGQPSGTVPEGCLDVTATMPAGAVSPGAFEA